MTEHHGLVLGSICVGSIMIFSLLSLIFTFICFCLRFSKNEKISRDADKAFRIMSKDLYLVIFLFLICVYWFVAVYWSI